MKWKNRLKTVLAEAAKTEICLEKALTKADKTQPNLVLSAFVSERLGQTSEKSKDIGVLPECSNCGLKLEIWENKLFCAMGCKNSAS
jgi:hypothetical protein